MKTGEHKAPGSDERMMLLQRIEEQEPRDARSSLLLGGRVIDEGDHLVLHIFDGWIAGIVRQDRGRWYLVTAAQVSILLSAGLTARWAENEEE